MLFQFAPFLRVSSGLALSIGLIGGIAMAVGPSNACVQAVLDAGISEAELRSLLLRVQYHRTLFEAEGRYLSLRTLGKPVSLPRQGSAREEILRDCPGNDCALGYAKLMSHEVQIRIDSSLPKGALNTPELRAQLFESRPGQGIVILLHQKPEFHETTRQRLSTEVALRGLPRLAIADEVDPIDGSLREQLTSVRYCHHSFCPTDVKLAAEGETYQVHLFGGYLTENTFRTLAVSLLPVYEQKSVKQVTFYIYNDAGYLLATYGDIASLQTLSAADNTIFNKMAENLRSSFGSIVRNKALNVELVP